MPSERNRSFMPKVTTQPNWATLVASTATSQTAITTRAAGAAAKASSSARQTSSAEPPDATAWLMKVIRPSPIESAMAASQTAKAQVNLAR